MIAWLRQFLVWLRLIREPDIRARLSFSAGPMSLAFFGDFTMKISVLSQVAATIGYVDARGNPAVVDGAPAWATDRPDLVSLVASEDGLSCTLVPLAVGTAQISVAADADLGEGTRELVTLGTLEIIAAEAVAGVISFGEPFPQPSA